MTTLSVLNGRGDTKLTWDHSDPEQCAAARRTVLDLKAQGYTFFLVDGTPADEVAAGGGALVVRRLDAEEVAPPAAEPAPEPGSRLEPDPVPPVRRRGRPPKIAGDTNVVAVRPLRGG